MKRIILFTLIFFAGMTAFAQKKSPARVRVEVVEVESDDKEYSIFSYTDKDGTFGYYLTLDSSDLMPGHLIAYDPVTETCVYMGSTLAEVKTTLQTMVDLLKGPFGVEREFLVRTAVGERLDEGLVKSNAVVSRWMLRKVLSFPVNVDNRDRETFLYKGASKSLLVSLKVYMKFHPDEQ